MTDESRREMATSEAKPTQIRVDVVPGEQLVAPQPREGDLDLSAHEAMQEVQLETVDLGLFGIVDGVLEAPKRRLMQDQLEMIGTEALGDEPGVAGLVPRLSESKAEGLEGAAVMLADECHDAARVHPSRETHADGHIR